MTTKTTIDPLEIAKFAQHANQWWDANGALKTLHDINPTRLEFIQSFCTLSDKKILDIGCGGGILCEGMAKVGAQVTGLDAEPEAIAVAQQHAQKQGLAIDYVCSPVEHYLENQPPLFDVITCMEMLEHVAEPDSIIQHAARLLKPEGVLFLSTLNRTFKAYATAILGAEYVLNILPRQTHDYEKFIKPSELSHFIRKAGLEPEAISGLQYNPFTRKASLQTSVDVNYLLVCRRLSM